MGFAATPMPAVTRIWEKPAYNWQITQQLDLGLNGSFTYDNYDAALGVQNRRSAGINFDSHL